MVKTNDQEEVVGRLQMGEYKTSSEGNWQKVEGKVQTYNMKTFGKLRKSLGHMRKNLKRLQAAEVQRYRTQKANAGKTKSMIVYIY